MKSVTLQSAKTSQKTKVLRVNLTLVEDQNVEKIKYQNEKCQNINNLEKGKNLIRHHRWLFSVDCKLKKSKTSLVETFFRLKKNNRIQKSKYTKNFSR